MKRIMAIVMLPILVFYMTSMNFLVGEMMSASAASGSGTMTVDDDEVSAGAAGQTFKFTFDPSEDMDGGAVRISIPSTGVASNWPQPTEGDGNGKIVVTEKSGADLDGNGSTGTVGSSAIDISGREITIDIAASTVEHPEYGLKSNQYFTVTYQVSAIPTKIGDYIFTTESKLAGGSFNDLSDSRQALVEVEPGAVDSYEITNASGEDIANQTAGVNFNILVTAYDEYGNVTAGSSSVEITADDAAGSLSGDTTADTSTDGTDTLSLKYTKPVTGLQLIPAGEVADASNEFAVANIAVPASVSPSTSTNDSTPLVDWSDVTGTGVKYEMNLVKKVAGACADDDYSSPLASYSGSASQYQLVPAQALLDETTYCIEIISADDYSNTVSKYEDFNLLTSKPAAPTDETIETVGSIATYGHPADTINIYNNESVTVTVTHAGTLDGGKAYVKITDGLNNSVEGNANISGADTTTEVTLDASSLQQGSLTIKSRVEDAGTNSSDWTGGSAATKDTSAPARASAVSFVDNPINAGNDDSVNISVTGENGAEAYYEITDEGEAHEVSNHFTMTGATTESPSINLTALNDGTITAEVYFVDSAWNHSNGEEGMVTKDATAPDAEVSYDLNRPVKDVDTLRVTATFSEDVKDDPIPQIAIDFAGAGSSNIFLIIIIIFFSIILLFYLKIIL